MAMIVSSIMPNVINLLVPLVIKFLGRFCLERGCRKHLRKARSEELEVEAEAEAEGGEFVFDPDHQNFDGVIIDPIERGDDFLDEETVAKSFVDLRTK